MNYTLIVERQRVDYWMFKDEVRPVVEVNRVTVKGLDQLSEKTAELMDRYAAANNEKSESVTQYRDNLRRLSLDVIRWTRGEIGRITALYHYDDTKERYHLVYKFKVVLDAPRKA